MFDFQEMDGNMMECNIMVCRVMDLKIMVIWLKSGAKRAQPWSTFSLN